MILQFQVPTKKINLDSQKYEPEFVWFKILFGDSIDSIDDPW